MQHIRTALGFLVLILVTGACKLVYHTGNIDYHPNREYQSIAEGKRMAVLICGPCHFNSSSKDFSGNRMYDVPRFIGKVYASNITQEMESGIGKYTHAELAYLIRTGVSRTGKFMPFMQRPNLSDTDLENIIAFLKSDDVLVKPNQRIPGKTDYTAVGKMVLGRLNLFLTLRREMKNQTISWP
jgi:hypothetical protein